MIGNPFKNKDTTLNFIYSAGAAVVILGTLFKLNHWNIGALTGSWILAIGLGVEAIFLIFAFDAPKKKHHTLGKMFYQNY